MSFRLSKKEVDRLGELRKTLRNDRELLTVSYDVRIAEMLAAVDGYNKLVAEHNERLVYARTFVTEIASRFRDDYDERSERWQESEAGQNASAFVEDWENAQLDDVEPMRLLIPDAPEFEESLNLPEESD